MINSPEREEDMTTLPAAQTLADLANHHRENSVSILMPTHHTGREVEQNAIRFKNLLRRVIRQLVEAGAAEGEVGRRLAPLVARQRDDQFWQHQTSGVAIYFADGEETIVHLHAPPDELAYTADHFYLTPVALDEYDRRQAWVLAVSWERAALFAANRDSLTPVESDLFPVELRDVVLPPDPEEHLQFRTQRQRPGGTMFHGQGEGEAVIESDRLRFLAEVAKRYESAVQQSNRPLIVVAADEVHGHLTSVSKLKPAHAVAASPDALEPPQLRERVQKALEQLRDDKQLAEQLGTALANGRATQELDAILQAASQGRVERLLVDAHERRWGTWDGETLSLVEGPSEDGAVCELINLAVVRTLQTGGEIAEFDASQFDSAPVAALLRY